jgi:hypothetical protein
MLTIIIRSGVCRQLWVCVFFIAGLSTNFAFADWNSGVTIEDVSSRIAINVVDDGVEVAIDLAENALTKLHTDSSVSNKKQLIDEFAKNVVRIKAERDLVAELKPDTAVASRVVFFRFSNKPKQIAIIPDFKVIEGAGSKYLITVAHQGLPVIDHGVLTSAETLLLDWRDPWYSHFQNPELKRGHSDPVMAFLYIEPRQIKSEIVVRVKEMAGWMELGLRDNVMIYPEEFAVVKEKIGQFLLAKNNLSADSKKLVSVLEKVDYIRMGAADIQAYKPQKPQNQAATLIGVSIVHQVKGIPNKIQWRWPLFNDRIQRVAIRAYDPAGLFDSYVMPEYPVFEWENMLADIDISALGDSSLTMPVAIKETNQQLKYMVILVGIGLLVLVVLVSRYFDSSQRKVMVPVVLLIGVLVGYISLNNGRSVLGAGSGLDELYAKTVLKQLLWNVYQAFEASQEDVAYDQLSYSVSGDLQETLYLQNRQSFLVADGGLSDVKSIEIKKVTDISPMFGGGNVFDCEWLVVGEVIHWGHQHRRENIYHAKIKLLPMDGYWKIVEIEPIGQQRVDGGEAG